MADNVNALADTSFFTAVLDTLIPASGDGKLPGAGRLGLASEVAAAIEGNEHAAALVEDGLEAVRDATAGSNGGFAALDLPARVEAIEAQLKAHRGSSRASRRPCISPTTSTQLSSLVSACRRDRPSQVATRSLPLTRASSICSVRGASD